MKTIIRIDEVDNNLSQFIHRVQDGKEDVVIEEAGQEIAALVNISVYNEFRQWYAKQLMKQMGAELSTGFEEMGITTEEQLADLMEADRKAVYEEYYGTDA